MKRIDFYYFLTLGILAVAFLGVPHFHHKPAIAKIAVAVTNEQRASHLVRFLDDAGEEKGSCTATAIGPNAILTAEHCNRGDKSSVVSLDLSCEKFLILASAKDHRDHVIYLLVGSPFRNIETVRTAPSAPIGETVTFYGNDRGWYPAIPHYGKVKDCDDPSDLDADAGEKCFDFTSVSGDSGAAIYDTKGQIVSLNTYGDLDDAGKVIPGGIGFSLNFSQEALDAAATFVAK